MGYIAYDSEIDWLLHHLVSTHDIWHVVTGWDNDEAGEYGLGAFYMAQLGGPPFFGYLLGLAALSTALRRRSFRAFMDAVVAGYQMGKRAEPLLGTDWAGLWDVPIEELRARFAIDQRPILEVPNTLPMRRKYERFPPSEKPMPQYSGPIGER